VRGVEVEERQHHLHARDRRQGREHHPAADAVTPVWSLRIQWENAKDRAATGAVAGAIGRQGPANADQTILA
jgi:hypothetical protein